MLEIAARLPQFVVDQAVAAARHAAQAEACGVLIGRAGAVIAAASIRNTATSTSEFALDALQLAHAERTTHARGRAILGYFHSHPRAAGLHDLSPSSADRAGLCWAGRGPRLSLIVSPAGAWALYEIGGDDWRLLADGAPPRPVR